MSYAALAERHRRIAHLQHVEAITSWDEAAMMPTGGGEARAEALATLRVICHELATAPQMADELTAAQAELQAGKLAPWEAANLREIERGYVRETAPARGAGPGLLAGRIALRASLARSAGTQRPRRLPALAA